MLSEGVGTGEGDLKPFPGLQSVGSILRVSSLEELGSWHQPTLNLNQVITQANVNKIVIHPKRWQDCKVMTDRS